MQEGVDVGGGHVCVLAEVFACGEQEAGVTAGVCAIAKVFGERIGARWQAGVLGEVVFGIEIGVWDAAFGEAVGAPMLERIDAGGEHVGVVGVVVGAVEAGFGIWAGCDGVAAGGAAAGEKCGEGIGLRWTVGGAVLGEAELGAGIAALPPAIGRVVGERV